MRGDTGGDVVCDVCGHVGGDAGGDACVDADEKRLTNIILRFKYCKKFRLLL